MNKGWKERFLFLILSFVICFLFLKIGIQNSATKLEFKNKYPNLFYEIGIQNPTTKLLTNTELPEPTPLFEAPVPEPKIEIENFISVVELTNEDRYIVHGIVAGEAGYESMDGKMAVAQCIKDAMLKDDIGASTVQSKYGYAGWFPELESTNVEAWAEVVEAVCRVFDNGQNITQENILWFYAPKYTTSKWHETQKYVGTFGTQRFFAPW